MKNYGIFARYEVVDDLSPIEGEFDSETAQTIFKEIGGDDKNALRTLLMNRVQKIEAITSDNPLVLLKNLEKGKGLLCGGMSYLYFNALRGAGHKARVVQLFRDNVRTLDVHQSVEVFENGRWLLSDPTFNVKFLKDGKAIGASEVQKTLHSQNPETLSVRFLGKVNYPARLDQYYLNWPVLFNHVLIEGRSVHASQKKYGTILAKVPPFRYWFGPVYYYENPPGKDPFTLVKILYAMVIVVLPILLILIILTLTVQVYRGFRSHTKL